MLKRFCALAVSGAIVGALMAVPPATADTPEVFAGTAAAQTLKLDALGIKLTVGATSASADSTPKAHADGAGLAILAGTVSHADAAGSVSSDAPPKACALSLPIQGILDLALACSQSQALTAGGSPTGSSTATLANIDVGVLNLVLQLLKPITDALVPVLDQVIGSVTGVLQPVLGPLLNQLLPGLGLNLQSPVSSLVTALQKVTLLARVTLGQSASVVTTTGGGVTSTALAKGGQIDLLPGLTLTGGPLVSIVLGSSGTTASFDRNTGKSAASFDPALLTLKVLGTSIPIAGAAPITLFAGTVLESTITVGGGRTVTNSDGSVGAVADGVSVHLLKGIAGGINLDLVHAESAVGGAHAVITAATTTTTSTTVVGATTTTTKPPILVLAHTGSEVPYLPIGMFLIVAGYLTRRRLARNRI